MVLQHQHLHFSSCFQGKPRLASSILFCLFLKRTSRDKWHTFLQVGYPSCIQQKVQFQVPHQGKQVSSLTGDAENARHELVGHENAAPCCRGGNARHENARNAIVWNTECCICLSIADQECTSRQERAPDFAADCVLVNV